MGDKGCLFFDLVGLSLANDWGFFINRSLNDASKLGGYQRRYSFVIAQPKNRRKPRLQFRAECRECPCVAPSCSTERLTLPVGLLVLQPEKRQPRGRKSKTATPLILVGPMSSISQMVLAS